jgi:choline dehydrogenase-like flavoprotein
MIADLAAVDDISLSDASVCVIGSGPAGAVLSVELARTGVDVLLLEASGHEPEPETGNHHYSFARQLGGSSNLWAGRCAPLEPLDFASRPWVPDSGWPLTRNDLDPYYERASALLELPPHVSAPEDAPNGIVDIKRFRWASTPFKAGRYLREAVRQYDNLTILLHAPVGRIRGDCVEIMTPAGRTRRARANVIVLAAGGIETPRVLLNSGIGNDNTGRYFSTHPKADMAVLVLSSRRPTSSPLFTDTPVAGGRVRHGIGFTADAQERFGLLNHYVQATPLPESSCSRVFATLRGSSPLDSAFVDKSRVLRGLLPGLGMMAAEALERLARRPPTARTFVLRVFLDQYPDPANRVTLDQKRDGHGLPLAGVTWRHSERDRRSVRDFFTRLDAAFRSARLGHVEFSRLGHPGDWPLTAIHSHFMGATRMGNDPQTAVTDEHGEIHGRPNLFVAGPSLFPSYGYANPFYTIVALSLRLADHLKARLDARS